jgi:PadR family transcriptional regulator, regulatory protein PadR
MARRFLLSEVDTKKRRAPYSAMPHDRSDLLQGTLDLLILKGLLGGRLHGWALSKRVRELSRDALQINQGSLYPALYRLEARRLVRAEWGVSDEGRRARFYTLTAAGRKQFTVERAEWRRFAGAIELVLASV